MKTYMGTEAQIVFQNNHHRRCYRPPYHDDSSFDPPKELNCPYGPDILNIFDINGKHVGYSWNYGDSVELVIDIQNTVLRVREDQLDELEVYLSNKEIEVNFINMRGEVDYTFYIPANLHSKLRLNTDETNLIEKNTYTCTLVLINPHDLSRINLLVEPYRVYVK